MIIVIDGPAGSGKSSTAKKIAEIHGLKILDSGAFYRTCTLIYLDNAKPSDEELVQLLDRSEIIIEERHGVLEVIIDGRKVTKKLRSMAVNESVSDVASMPAVRDWVNNRMRKFVENGRFIADGRDLGTVVFPNAAQKFWLHADPEVRAKRRVDELVALGHIHTDHQEVLSNILERDAKDSSRVVAPLKKAEDAIIIDTTNCSFEEQVLKISSYISELL
jgi:cytidylate kinase